jgi:cupin superfamily acireductone dioxygenase involved in methionine salvage|tara:strand:- start:46 stop:546 length:501 start_codon:yes stop_codon:yes gene_type:complete
MNIKIIDNFLSTEDFRNLKDKIFDQDKENIFPWFLQNFKVDKQDDEIQFTHVFYRNNLINSKCFNVLKPILDKLKIKTLHRIKANITFKKDKVYPYKYHVDFNVKNMIGNVGIFYLHTTNGPTYFENNKKVNCVKNRMVIFPSNIFHAGSTHTDNKIRGVINFNWF